MRVYDAYTESSEHCNHFVVFALRTTRLSTGYAHTQRRLFVSVSLCSTRHAIAVSQQAPTLLYVYQ